MKVIELRAGKFVMAEAAVPELTVEKSVLISIKAVSFNPIDAQMRNGMSEIKLAKSSILGRDCAGIVEKTYSKNSSLKSGDRVCAYVGSLGSNGTHAEYVAVPEEIIAPIPGSMSFEIAACLPVGCTALQAFDRSRIKNNDSVLITGGAGGVGTLLVQLIRNFQPRLLVATYGNADSRDHLVSLGVKPETLVNYENPTTAKDILSLNGGSTFDICFDLVGNKMSELCADVIAPLGKYIDVTAFSTPTARELLFDKGTNIICVANYAYSLWRESPKYIDQIRVYSTQLQRLISMIENKEIIPPKINRVGTFNAETVNLAVDQLDQNLSHGHKLIMTI